MRRNKKPNLWPLYSEGDSVYMCIAILDKRNRVVGWVDGWV